MAFINRMDGQDFIDKTREYLSYLEEHLENIRIAFIAISNACDGMAWVGDDCSWHTLRNQVMAHDLSKFSKEEFVQYRDAFYPVDDVCKQDSGFNDAYKNHIKKNTHHYGTAKTYNDIVHMVIDWTAMGYKFGDTAQSYYENNKQIVSLSKDHQKFIYEIFDRIRKAE